MLTSRIKAQTMLIILTMFLIFFSFVASEGSSSLALKYILHDRTIKDSLLNCIGVYLLAFISGKILPANIQKISSTFFIVLLGFITIILTPMQLNSTGFFGGYLSFDLAAVLLGCVGIIIAIGQLLTREKPTQIYSNKFVVIYLFFIDMFLFVAYFR